MTSYSDHASASSDPPSHDGEYSLRPSPTSGSSSWPKKRSLASAVSLAEEASPAEEAIPPAAA